MDWLLEQFRRLQENDPSQAKALLAYLQQLNNDTNLAAASSPEDLLEWMVGVLTSQNRIAPPSLWRRPDCKTSCQVLGLKWLPELIGRSVEIQAALEQVF